MKSITINILYYFLSDNTSSFDSSLPISHDSSNFVQKKEDKKIDRIKKRNNKQRPGWSLQSRVSLQFSPILDFVSFAYTGWLGFSWAALLPDYCQGSGGFCPLFFFTLSLSLANKAHEQMYTSRIWVNLFVDLVPVHSSQTWMGENYCEWTSSQLEMHPFDCHSFVYL